MALSLATTIDRSFKVHEGVGSELAPGLRDVRTDVLAFIAPGGDEASRRIKFGVLRQVAGMLDDVVEARRSRKFDALVDALTPDFELSPTKIIEARMLGAARTAVLESNDFVSASAVAEAAHFSAKNPSSQPNRWKRSKLIFAVPYKGTDLYPLYALDRKHGFRPRPIVAKVLSVFADEKDGWETAFWFESVNSYLGGKRPKDLVASDPGAVLKAAEIEAVGLRHG